MFCNIFHVIFYAPPALAPLYRKLFKHFQNEQKLSFFVEACLPYEFCTVIFVINATGNNNGPVSVNEHFFENFQMLNILSGARFEPDPAPHSVLAPSWLHYLAPCSSGTSRHCCNTFKFLGTRGTCIVLQTVKVEYKPFSHCLSRGRTKISMPISML
jgi:hypothetical protein